MIPQTRYIARRKALAQRAKTDVIIISGGDLVQKSSDETYEFEQDGYFYYLTGVSEPGWLLVIDVLKGEEFLISTDESSYHNDVWEVKFSAEEITNVSGIQTIMNRRDGWGYIRRECKNYQAIGTIVPKMRFIRSYGMFINPAKTMLVERLKRLHSDANLVDIGAHIRELRAVKDEDEIAAIRKAIEITRDGLAVVSSKLNEYANEAEVYADLAYSFLNIDSTFGYRPIIAAGANAVKLHYKVNNDTIDAGELLMIDVGATADKYSADITRTYQIGEVSQRHKDILAALADAQAQSLEFLKPGVSMMDHEAFAEQRIGEALNKLGVINTMLRKDIRRYFPHAIGHHLGIDVHDSCPYDQPLQPGAVITLEPGIYLPNEGIGARIEDNILITESGIEVLSKEISH